MTTVQQITTAEELLHAPGLGRCELVRGELVMRTPAGFEHGRIGHRIALRLGAFIEESHLGVVTTAETGFVLARNPDTVRAPDLAFIAADRIPESPIAGFFEGAPDVAVEVLSPGDRAGELLAKVQDWLASGCRAVWVMDPQKRTVSVYGKHGAVAVFKAGELLNGGDVLPGFSVSVDDLFAR